MSYKLSDMVRLPIKLMVLAITLLLMWLIFHGDIKPPARHIRNSNVMANRRLPGGDESSSNYAEKVRKLFSVNSGASKLSEKDAVVTMFCLLGKVSTDIAELRKHADDFHCCLLLAMLSSEPTEVRDCLDKIIQLDSDNLGLHLAIASHLANLEKSGETTKTLVLKIAQNNTPIDWKFHEYEAIAENGIKTLGNTDATVKASVYSREFSNIFYDSLVSAVDFAWKSTSSDDKHNLSATMLKLPEIFGGKDANEKTISHAIAKRTLATKLLGGFDLSSPYGSSTATVADQLFRVSGEWDKIAANMIFVARSHDFISNTEREDFNNQVGSGDQIGAFSSLTEVLRKRGIKQAVPPGQTLPDIE